MSYKDLEKYKAYQANWRKANSDKIKVYWKIQYKRNPDKIKASIKIYLQTDRGKEKHRYANHVIQVRVIN